MKIQGGKKIHYDSGPNMTPLVDVVMVILIFLMLTGSFGGAKFFLLTSLPTRDPGAGGIKVTPADVRKTTADIRVEPDNRDPTRYIARAGAISTGDYDTLKAELDKLRSQFPDPDQVQVII